MPMKTGEKKGEEREAGEVVRAGSPQEDVDNPDAPDSPENEQEAAVEEAVEEEAKEPEAFRPFFVPYRGEEEDEENDKADEAGGEERNPLDENPLEGGDTNPLDDDPLNAEPTTNPLGMDYGSEPSKDRDRTEGAGAQMNEDEVLLASATCGDGGGEVQENPLGEEVPLEGQEQGHEKEMSEEDLLGPAHNLDDSQYKADYADPNLDDIFK